MANYDDIVLSAQDLLLQHTEWKTRYKGYIEIIMDKKHRALIAEARKKFNVPKPFKLYLNLSMAKEPKENQVNFELRFHGQSVGIIYVKDNDIFLRPKMGKGKALINAAQSVDIDLDFGTSDTKWRSDTAKLFRKGYAAFEDKLIHDPSLCNAIGQPEHDMESELLSNYSRKSSADKEIVGIQPIKMAGIDARFQMPTPFRASDAKKGIVSYSGHSGGGIDILARVGCGRGTQLAIMELKDENTNSEPPELAIKEGIVYAAFIRELLRCNEAGCNAWWEFFGFGGSIPKKLVLKAVIVMPNKRGAAKDFAKQSLVLDHNDGTGDTVELEYIYREADGLPLETSL